MLYIILLLILLLMLLLYKYGNVLLIHFPSFNRRYQRLPAIFSTASSSSFQNDIEDGLTSESFDLQQNINSGDERSGLGDTDEIRHIMETHGLTFDQARLYRMQNKFKTNNIDPQTGVPKDPKLVTFS
ncbi:2816_t:CDS:2 [Diversispora eburnea]|uniref:2816_t:CDS:1 n=1 Tax=Diversispora eburnea TaxID=1213867 RepID=A0A9N8YJY0_9GLOM|nr:2816_t:CDS:2 [Diversispora eburnea]